MPAMAIESVIARGIRMVSHSVTLTVTLVGGNVASLFFLVSLALSFTVILHFIP